MPGAAVVGYPRALPVAFALAVAVVLTFPVAVPLALDQSVREHFHHDQRPAADRVAADAECQQHPWPDDLAVSFGVALRDLRNTRDIGYIRNDRDA